MATNSEEILALYGNWFNLADVDRDGFISGREGVNFFSRSGLHKRLLAQVWDLSDVEKNGKLTRGQFFAALRLVAYAQKVTASDPNCAELNVELARNIVIGRTPFNGIPAIVGLEVPQHLKERQNERLSTGFEVTQAPPPAFHNLDKELSRVSAENYAKYQQECQAVDKDNDGFVQGKDCFPIFIQSGLDKPTLKHIWDIVAGNRGQLTSTEFVLCKHLITQAQAGVTLPSSLPVGFSLEVIPIAQPALSPATAIAAMGVNNDIPSQLLQPPQIAQAIPKVSPITGDFQYVPKTPALPFSNLDMFDNTQQRRMSEIQEETKKADMERQKMEYEATVAKQNLELYRNAMQELVMFKSRSEAQMIQLSAQLRSVSAELESYQKQYNERYALYEQALNQANAQKDRFAEAQQEKIKLLNDIEQMNNETISDTSYVLPLQEAEAEIAELRSQLNLTKQLQLEAKQKSKNLVSRAQVEKQNLQREIDAYKLEIEAAKIDAEKHDEDLQSTKERAQNVLSQISVDKQELSNVLYTSGKLFHSLSQSALKAGVEIPTFDSLKLEWSKSLAVNAEAWEEKMFNEGFTIVEDFQSLAFASEDGARNFRPEMPIEVDFQDEGQPRKANGEGKDSSVAEVGNLNVSESFQQESTHSFATDLGSLDSPGTEFGTKNMFASGHSTCRTDFSEDFDQNNAPTSITGEGTTDESAMQKEDKDTSNSQWISFDT